MIRLNEFDTYMPAYQIRIPDDLANEREFNLHTQKSFE